MRTGVNRCGVVVVVGEGGEGGMYGERREEVFERKGIYKDRESVFK